MARLILAEVLKKKKLSKRQFAKSLGVHYNHVFRYFRPGFNPKFRQLEQFASILKCRIRDLFEE